MFDEREHYSHPIRMGNKRKCTIPIFIHVGEEHPIDRNLLEIEEHDSLLLNFTFPDSWKYHTKRLCSVSNGRDLWTGWLDSENRFLVPMPIVHRDSLVIRIIGYTNQCPLPEAHIILIDSDDGDEHLVATTDKQGNQPEFEDEHFWARVPYKGWPKKHLIYRCGHFIVTERTPGDWVDIQDIPEQTDRNPAGYILWEMNDYPVKIERQESICKRNTKTSRDLKNSSLLKRYDDRLTKPRESPKMKEERKHTGPIPRTLL